MGDDALNDAGEDIQQGGHTLGSHIVLCHHLAGQRGGHQDSDGVIGQGGVKYGDHTSGHVLGTLAGLDLAGHLLHQPIDGTQLFTYGFIKPAADLDVIMVAPRMIGKGVRETYENGTGFPTFVVINQDATGHAKEIAVGLAKALGSTKAGAIEVTFNDETYLDLMSEQAIWPLIMNVMVTAFDFFHEKGLPAEAILTEMYMSKEPMVMMEKMADMGLFKQLPLHSRTSQYGQLSRFKMVDNSSMRKFIEEQYNNIVNGTFAKEWEEVKADGMKKFDELWAETEQLPISQVEGEVRKNLSGGKHAE